MENTDNQPVNVFIPCCMDLYNPEIAEKFMRLIWKLGLQIHYNPQQTCCGRQFYFSGQKEVAEEFGIKFTKLLKLNFPVLFPTTACPAYIKHYFPKMFHNTHTHHEVKILINQVFEISDFIVNKLGKKCLGNKYNNRVYYFKSCQARNLYGLGDEPETLLRNTEGLDLIVRPENDLCCTGNNDFYLHNPQMSDELLKRLIEDAYNSGAQVITTTDIHCLQHITSYLNTLDVQLTPLHVVEIYASGL